jgi:serine/threonine protein phosphatase PrpC
VIKSKRPHLFVAARTHPGMRGKNNEDRYSISAFYVDENQRVPSVFAMVSDGIGGHRAGEVAAEIAVETINQVVSQSDASQPVLTLEDAIIQASEAIRLKAETEAAQKGMGATCVCAWVIGDRLYTASVGDSRLYLIREHTIRKLSTDHTWVQEAIDQGAISPDQARSHPNAHVIRRYLGSPQMVVPDMRLRLRPDDSNSQAEDNQGLPLLPGDVLVLCSDGLTDLVDDPEILENIETKNLEEALTELESLANQRGGHDNITVIALEMPPAGTALTSVPSKEITKPLFLETASAEITQRIKRSDLEPVQKAQKLPRRLILLAGLAMASIVILAVGSFGVITWISVQNSHATTTPTLQTAAPSITVVASPQQTTVITPTELTITPTAQTTLPPQATLTPWPTNTFLPPSNTPGNPFITSIP